MTKNQEIIIKQLKDVFNPPKFSIHELFREEDDEFDGYWVTMIWRTNTNETELREEFYLPINFKRKDIGEYFEKQYREFDDEEFADNWIEDLGNPDLVVQEAGVIKATYLAVSHYFQ